MLVYQRVIIKCIIILLLNFIVTIYDFIIRPILFRDKHVVMKPHSLIPNLCSGCGFSPTMLGDQPGPYRGLLASIVKLFTLR